MSTCHGISLFYLWPLFFALDGLFQPFLFILWEDSIYWQFTKRPMCQVLFKIQSGRTGDKFCSETLFLLFPLPNGQSSALSILLLHSIFLVSSRAALCFPYWFPLVLEDFECGIQDRNTLGYLLKIYNLLFRSKLEKFYYNGIKGKRATLGYGLAG